MIQRKAYDQLVKWKNVSNKTALLVTGARQVGKTYIIRKFGQAEYEHFVEINFIENLQAKKAFNEIIDTSDFMLKISLFSNDKLVKNNTLIFLDEVQECPEIISAIKFLCKSKDFDFVLSGSLLGTELKDIRSWPVGYLTILDMFPIDFEEFCWANNISKDIIEGPVANSFYNHTKLADPIHLKLSSLFHYYLLSGGMPDAVKTYLHTNNIQEVRQIQKNIINLYRHDIAQYAKNDSRIIKQIFDRIPSELNKKNKRYIVKNIEGISRVSRYQNEFEWIVDTGVALPAYNVSEPRYPLLLSKEQNKYKLYLNDVGLLSCMCGLNVMRDIINDRPDINYGSIYENIVAQELYAHGFDLYYFKNRKIGELDFLIQTNTHTVVPIEVKSGKNYKRHSALNNALNTYNYGIEQAIVFCEGNVVKSEKVVYLPIYMSMFLKSVY